MARTFVIHDRAPAAAEIEELAAIIGRGEVVILPTDTIYGLHAGATNREAVAKIFRIKGRDERKPLVVLAAGLEQLTAMGVVLDEHTADVLRSIWPAAMTAILRLSRSLPASAETSTIAVRIPNTDWLLDLVRLTGPLASTSVNRSGEPPLYTMSNLPQETKNQVAAVVDIGPLRGEASTIVDFTEEPPRIVREGEFRFSQNLWKTSRKSL